MHITGEWDLNPQEISDLYRAKGWEWHLDGQLRTPSPEDIEAMLGRMATEIINDPDVIATQSGRLMIWKDEQSPHSFGLFLNIGFIWDDAALHNDTGGLL